MAVIKAFQRHDSKLFIVHMSCGHSQLIAHRPGRERPNVGQSWPCASCPKLDEMPRAMTKSLPKKMRKVVLS